MKDTTDEQPWVAIGPAGIEVARAVELDCLLADLAARGIVGATVQRLVAPDAPVFVGIG